MSSLFSFRAYSLAESEENAAGWIKLCTFFCQYISVVPSEPSCRNRYYILKCIAGIRLPTAFFMDSASSISIWFVCYHGASIDISETVLVTRPIGSADYCSSAKIRLNSEVPVPRSV